MERRRNRRNIRLVMAETVVTSFVISIPIMTPFFNSIGLNQKQIAFTQMCFTAAVMLLNIPLGWVADSFGRKKANIIGDIMCAIALLCYSQVQNMWQVITCEILFGVGCAFSQGVDSSLLKHFCDKDDSSGRKFDAKFASCTNICHIATLIALFLGGPIGAISFRLAIALSSTSYIAGAILSVFVVDDSPLIERVEKQSVFRQIFCVTAKNLRNRKLRQRIFAYVIVRECTHGVVWAFTPILMAVGVPMSIISIGWCLNEGGKIIGSTLAIKFAGRLAKWKIFALPIALISLASITLFCSLNIVTVWIYSLFGIATGWVSATALPVVKRGVDPTEQATVESSARVCSQLVYIPAVWLINYFSDINIRYAFLATFLIFVPLAMPAIWKIKKQFSE